MVKPYLALIALAFYGCAAQEIDTSESRPNIVIVYTDDQGWQDVGVYGAIDFSTPNLDRLAAEGIRFTDFYVSQPVCSASRASLLTGCYANRLDIHGALNPNSENGLKPSEVTIAELCKQRGYATANYGKWHLGNREQFLPTRQGFDTFEGIPYSNDMWPNHPESPKAYPPLPYLVDETIVRHMPDQSQFTTDFTNLTTKFIREAHAADTPFFVYLAHPMPHVPLYVSDKFAGSSEQGLYGDVIQEIDWSVGEIMNTLDELNIAENTLVIFCSDNGPWLSYGNHAGAVANLREGKGTTFEGGIRVPFIARYPGKIQASSVCNEPAMTIDVLPTIANLIAAEMPAHKIDGKDIWSLLTGDDQAVSPHEAYYFYYRTNELQAMRSGKWKLHFPHNYRSLEDRAPGNDGTPSKYNYSMRTAMELYDLENDISESTNVVNDHPQVLAKMLKLAEEMRADLGDSLLELDGPGVR
ncbi:MAG: arylsulfatase A [Myxococcota bacterium]|jgi:arylsulfatase A